MTEKTQEDLLVVARLVLVADLLDLVLVADLLLQVAREPTRVMI